MAEKPTPTTTPPMSQPLFRRLLVARFVSNVGNGMGPTALAFGVLAIPGATGKELGFVLAAQAIPMLLLMPFGGVLADRRSRAAVVAISDVILGALVVAEGALFVTGQATVTVVAAINVVAGALAALWWPAFPGLVPAVLGDRDLQRGNSLIAVASNVAYIGGAAVAGVLVATFGAGTALIVDGASFLVAGALVYGLRGVTTAAPSGESVARDLREGWGTFISFRWLWVSVAAWSVVNALIRGAYDVGGPVLMERSFDGAGSWAFLQTAMAIGFLVGSAAAARLRPSRPLVFLNLASFALPASMLALALRAPFAVIGAGFFLVGLSLELWGVIWPTVVQINVPRDRLSRASAFDALGTQALGPVGLAIAGPVIASVGLPALFIGSTAICVVMLLAPLFVREVRGLVWRADAPSAGPMAD